MKTIELDVPGAHCGTCRAVILDLLGTVPGVARAEVDLRNRRATAVVDPAVTDVETIRRTLAAGGYPAVPHVGSTEA